VQAHTVRDRLGVHAVFVLRLLGARALARLDDRLELLLLDVELDRVRRELKSFLGSKPLGKFAHLVVGLEEGRILLRQVPARRVTHRMTVRPTHERVAATNGRERRARPSRR